MFPVKVYHDLCWTLVLHLVPKLCTLVAYLWLPILCYSIQIFLFPRMLANMAIGMIHNLNCQITYTQLIFLASFTGLLRRISEVWPFVRTCAWVFGTLSCFWERVLSCLIGLVVS